MVCKGYRFKFDTRLYSPETGVPPCIPSTSAFAMDLHSHPITPVYTNLWANTPRDIMQFTDQKFPSGTPDFPFRSQVLEYLQEYGRSVRHLIEFNKEVLKVEKRQGKWLIEIRDTTEPAGDISSVSFDALAVATGTSSLADFFSCI